MGIILRWDITNKCSLNCIHCYNHNTRESVNEINNREDLNKIITNLPQDSIRFMKLLGGEPFEFSEIVFLTDQLKRNNIKFGITTNGMFEKNKENISIINNPKLVFITFSLDGHNQQSAEVFRRNIDFNSVIQNIELVKMLRPEIPISIILILNKFNFTNIYSILDYFFNIIKINKICLTDLKITHQNLSKMKCDKNDLIEVVKQVNKFKSNTNTQCNIELNFGCNMMLKDLYHNQDLVTSDISLDYRCTAGRDSGYIDYLGNLLPCDAILENENYSNIKESREYSLVDNDFWDIWVKPEFDNVYKYDLEFRYGSNINVTKSDDCMNCNYRETRCSKCFFQRGS